MFKSEAVRLIAARLALLFVAIFWGSSLVVVKMATGAFSPNLLLAVRFTIAFIVLSIIFYKKYKLLNNDYLKSGVIIGICLFLAYCTQTIGVTFAMPGKSGFLSAVYCVIVPFLSWAIQKRRPDKYNFAATMICGVGIVLASITAEFSIEFGDFLALLSGFFFALHIVSISHWGSKKDSVLITILQFGTAAICSWISFFTVERAPIIDFSNHDAILGVLYLAIVCTAVSLLLQNLGQKYTDPSSASIILSLESVFGVVFSVIFFHEKLNLQLTAGFVLIFVAIIISETKLNFLKKDKIARVSDSIKNETMV